MALYYFHLSDGHEVIIDAEGKEIEPLGTAEIPIRFTPALSRPAL